MASVAINGVGKAFGSIHVIHDVNIEIATRRADLEQLADDVRRICAFRLSRTGFHDMF
jgi:hypothetical protein